MAKHQRKITDVALRHIDTLCTTAMSHGWHEDQGNGSSVDVAEKDYLEARLVLINYINYLQEKIKDLKKSAK